MKFQQANSIYIHLGTYEGSLLGFKGDLQNLQNEYSFTSSQGSIKTICRVGKYLLTGGYEEAIKIYDLRKKKEVGVLEDHKGTISVIRNFNNFIFSGSEDGTIKVWKTKDWALLQTLPSLKQPIVDICVHKSGKIMLSLTKDYKIQVWNLMTLKRLFQRKFEQYIQKVCFLDNEGEDVQQILLLGQYHVYIVDCETNKICNSVKIQNALTDIALYKDLILLSGNIILLRFADQQGFVHFLRMDKVSHKIILTFRAHLQRVKQLQVMITEEMSILCTVSSNGEVKLWDILNFVQDEVQDTVELDTIFHPINLVKTMSRLTCVCMHEFTESPQQEITKQPEPVQTEKPSNVKQQLVDKLPLQKQSKQKKMKKKSVPKNSKHDNPKQVIKQNQLNQPNSSSKIQKKIVKKYQHKASNKQNGKQK